MAGLKDKDTGLQGDIRDFSEITKDNSSLVSKQSNLSNFRFDYNRVGGTNTPNGNFQLNQEKNIAGDSELSKKTSLFQGETGTTLPPEVKGRLQAAETALEPFSATDKGGVEHLFKQGILHKFNAQEDTQKYDPTSLLTNLVVPGGTDNFGSPFTKHKEEDVDIQVGQNISYVKPGGDNQKLGINVVLNRVNTPTGRIKVKSILDDKVSYNMQYPDTSGAKNTNSLQPKDKDNEIVGLPKDFIDFRIKDVINGRIIQFPAYLNDITDNSSAEYNPTRYIGKADQVYVYTGYTRNISFGFRVAALTRGDIPVMWNKIDYLKQLALPTYSDKVYPSDNSSEMRPVAPIVELTIGNLYRNQTGFFSGINLTMPQTSNWELEEGYQLTHLCDISLEFTFIGKSLPQNSRVEGKQTFNDSRQFDLKTEGLNGEDKS